MELKLSVQEEITPSTAILVAYVGSRTIHNVLQTDNSNIVLPTLTSVGYLWPCGPDPLVQDGGTGGPCVSGYSPARTNTSPLLNHTLNPPAAHLSGTFFNLDPIYPSVQVQLTKKSSHGLPAPTSYTS